MIAIIILNWNGADDTIACLDSLYSAEDDFFVMLADNGSEDDSLERINKWLSDKGINHKQIERGTVLGQMPENRECVMVTMRENLGFARGNNEALAVIKEVTPEYVMLLNNDTLVSAGFLATLISFFAEHPSYVALTPRIHYNNPRELIWNCGGKLRFGTRKYYYAHSVAETIKESGHIDITFITGCALIAKKELLDGHNHLLTNRFFFGEEDYEFSLRMQASGKKLACVLDSVIYHKVNASVNVKNLIGVVYINALNRGINLRQNKGSFFCLVWFIAFSLHFVPVLIRSGYSLRQISKMLFIAWHNVRTKESVTREDFTYGINQKFG